MFDQEWAEGNPLLDEVDHPIFVQDDANRVIYWNRAAERIYGLSGINAVGKLLPEIITVERCSATREERDSALSSKGRWQGNAVHVPPSGERLRVEWRQLRLASAPGKTISLVKALDKTRDRELKSGPKENPLSHLSEDLHCMVTFNGTFKQLNPAWTRVLGWSEAEILAKSWTELIHPDDLDETIRTARKHIAQDKKYYTVDNRYIHQDGSWRYLSWNALLLHETQEIFAIARDLTDFHHAQQELQLSEIRSENLIKASPMGIHQYQLNADDQLVFMAANPASDTIFGYPAKQLIGKPIEEAFPKFAAGGVAGHYRRAAGDGEPWHTTNLLYNDEKITRVFNVWAFQTSPGCMAALFLDITPQTKVREALRGSEEMFSKAFHSCPALMTIADLEDGRFVDVNSAFERITGYSREDALGYSPIELNLLQNPSDMERVSPLMQEGGTIHNFEASYLNKHGETGQGSFSFETFKLGQNRLVMTVMTDITERVQAEGRQRDRLERIQLQQEAIFRLATQTAINDGDLIRALHTLTEAVAGALRVERVSFWLLVDQGATMRCLDLFINSEARHTTIEPLPLEMFPLYLAALKSGRALDAHDATADPRIQELAPYLKEHGITSMLDAAVRVSGTIRGVVCHEHIGPPRVWQPDEIAFAGAVADQITQAITAIEQWRIELALRDSEAKLRSIFRSAPVGICLVTGVKISWINDKMASFLGTTLEELSGKEIHQLYSPERSPDHLALTEQLEKQEAATLETQWVKQNGDLADVLLNATRLDPSDAHAGITLTVLDITERKRAEEDKATLESQLRQSQKMESIGRLAGGIAHDFNNLLTGILGYCDLIFNSMPPSEPIFSELKEIQRAGERAAALTNQLLAFSRKQIIDPKVLEPNVIIAQSTKMMERIIGEDIELAFHPADDLFRIKADSSQLDQILINLAANSRDAMPQGGQLTIETRNVTLDEAFCGLRAEITPGRYILLAFTDTGCGMSESVQKHIFEPFFSTKPKDQGTGLGMAMVYGIVKQNNGYIGVYSEENIGTTIKIYFPMVTERAPRVSEEPTALLPGGQEHILLVEDEEIVRNLAKTVLQGRGYVVLEAQNGLEALQLSQDYQKKIDLLLTDVVLPKMNGKELYSEIKKARPEINVLFVSGYTENVIAHHGILEEGMNFMQKPFTIAALTKRVREILDN